MPETINSTPATAANGAVTADSVDTAVATGMRLHKWDHRHSTELDAPQAMRAERPSGANGVVAYTTGLKATERPQLPGYDSGVMLLLIAMFVVMAANFRHYGAFFKKFTRSLFNDRSRSFDDHTPGEWRIMLSLTMLVTVSEGILAFSAITSGVSVTSPFGGLCACVGVTVAYYLWQVGIYNTVGYTFSNKEVRLAWVKAFNSSQSLLGLALFVPALMVLFYPGISGLLTGLAIMLYGAARLLFIVKGFRLFYTNLFSLLYFILYLCTLEVVPLLLIAKLGATLMS